MKDFPVRGRSRSAASSVASHRLSITQLCVELLRSYGANQFVRNDAGQTPIDIAREHGFHEVMDALVNAPLPRSHWSTYDYEDSFRGGRESTSTTESEPNVSSLVTQVKRPTDKPKSESVDERPRDDAQPDYEEPPPPRSMSPRATSSAKPGVAAAAAKVAGGANKAGSDAGDPAKEGKKFGRALAILMTGVCETDSPTSRPRRCAPLDSADHSARRKINSGGRARRRQRQSCIAALAGAADDARGTLFKARRSASHAL